ncbi:MAG: diacylglycerol kinase family lipid kinase [Opitutales bacterium]|nr:diacylglycerol kinase family lipid kinase [Opitutales bacterium]MCH8541245.1 diacylglycerol kinase family lipid kinase [Opitutales bacterium]
MKILVLLNPCSGKMLKTYPKVIARIEAFGQNAGWDLHIKTSESRGHCRKLAIQAAEEKQWDIIASCGGDGTLNEVAGGLVNTSQTFAILPMGTGNGLARHLGIPLNLEKALSVLKDPRIVSIDTGTANGEFFCNAAGMGFDAYVAQEFNAITGRHQWAYIKATLGCLRRYRPRTFYFGKKTPEAREVKGFLFTIANGSQYGMNARIAPGASVQNGKLDVVGVPLGSPWAALPAIVRMFCGTLTKSPKVFFERTESIHISHTGENVFHVDGEVRSYEDEVHFACQPESLKICLPQTERSI